MAVALTSLLTTVTEEEWLDLGLDILESLGFNATSWQVGSVQRTIVQLVARVCTSLSATIPQIAAGGFVGLATGGWLTVLSESHYQNVRTAAVATKGTFRLTATATAPPHTIAAGALQFATTPTQQPSTVTFRSLLGGTLSPGGTIDLVVEAEVAGESGNIPNNSALYMWTPLVGVTATNPPVGTTGTWISTTGLDAESDARLTERDTSKWSTLSYAATDGAYKNWALAANSSVTRVKVRSNNPFGPGTVDVICAKTSGGITTGSGSEAAAILSYIEGADGIGRRPLNDVVSVNSALVKVISVSGTVKVAAAFQSQTTLAAIQQAITDYFNELPIGGTVIPPASSGVAIYTEMIERVMALAGVISVTFTTPTADVALAENEILAGTNFAGLVASYV